MCCENHDERMNIKCSSSLLIVIVISKLYERYLDAVCIIYVIAEGEMNAYVIELVPLSILAIIEYHSVLV